MKFIRRKNEEQALRVELMCKETLCFIKELENALTNVHLSSAASVHLTLERARNEVNEIHRQYLDYVEECSHDFIEVKEVTMDRLKMRLDLLKEHLFHQLNHNTETKMLPFMPSSGTQSPDFLI